MAKKTITQNNVEFSVDTLGDNYQGWDKKYTNIENIIGGEYDPNGESLSVNAVDIDCSF